MDVRPDFVHQPRSALPELLGRLGVCPDGVENELAVAATVMLPSVVAN